MIYLKMMRFNMNETKEARMKMRVHNEAEANALIKEFQQNGSIFEYDKSQWFTHEGNFLFGLTVWLDGSVMKYVRNDLSASSV